MKRPLFLTAAWRNLAMVNWEVDPSVLAPHVPAGVELDTFEDRTFVSLVGFQFLDVRIWRMAIPFHRNFEEVNLRFYVRRKTPQGVRRGVCFIKEIAPKLAVSTVANWLYDENYLTAPMRHSVTIDDDSADVRYEWRVGGRWHFLAMAANRPWAKMEVGSEQEFIAEHYWGYSGTARHSREYEVEHPRWRIRLADSVEFECDIDRLYGPAFGAVLGRPYTSAFLADGSEISVRAANRFDANRQDAERSVG